VEPGGQVAAAAPELLLARPLLLGQGGTFLVGDDGGVDRLGGRRRSGRGLFGGRGASACQASQQAVHGLRGASFEAPRGSSIGSRSPRSASRPRQASTTRAAMRSAENSSARRRPATRGSA